MVQLLNGDKNNRLLGRPLTMTESGARSSWPIETCGVARVFEIRIPPLDLAGTLQVPLDAQGVIAFAHGSGSSRSSPRNKAVADALNARGFATLLFDLLTEAEESDRSNVFDIPLLADRLCDAVRRLTKEPHVASLPVGLFGASTGAAAALVAAARLSGEVDAIVSRGGRPDLAGDALDRIRTPTLLIVGGADFGVIELNERAFERLQGPKALRIVPRATHLFPEPGALQTVIGHAAEWFQAYLRRPRARPDAARSEDAHRRV
jgi:pimeloyl-ACP methyl ester carboxylesterase